MTRPNLLLAALLALLPMVALADRGALSIEAGGGMTGLKLPAPFSTPVKGQRTLSGEVLVGARYAFTNQLEVSASGFYEPPVTVWHNGVTVTTEAGSFDGTLTHGYSRYGFGAGGRLVFGNIWRLHVGMELGFSRRSYTEMDHRNDAERANIYSYGLFPTGNHRAVTNLLVSPMAGVEWMAGDRWSVSVMPRLHFLAGKESAVGVMVPVTLSYSFYNLF